MEQLADFEQFDSAELEIVVDFGNYLDIAENSVVRQNFDFGRQIVAVDFVHSKIVHLGIDYFGIDHFEQSYSKNHRDFVVADKDFEDNYLVHQNFYFGRPDSNLHSVSYYL